MRHVGDDLQGVPVAADLVVVELRLHARLVDEVLGRPAAEDHRGRARPADDEVGRLDDVPDDVDVAGTRFFLPRLRQAHADRGVGDRRAEDRHVGAVGGRQDALPAGRRP